MSASGTGVPGDDNNPTAFLRSKSRPNLVVYPILPPCSDHEYPLLRNKSSPAVPSAYLDQSGNKRPRAALMERENMSQSPPSKMCPGRPSAPRMPMSPPVTPANRGRVNSTAGSDAKGHESGRATGFKHTAAGLLGRTSDDDPTPNQSTESVTFSPTLPPRLFRGKYEMQGDDYDGYVEFGRGAWSSVRRATCQQMPTPADWTLRLPRLPSPPVTPPTEDEEGWYNPNVVAVKTPSSRSAKAVLENEARILTFLHAPSPDTWSSSDNHIVSFLGLDPDTGSLVLEAVPLTLTTFSQSRFRFAKESFSTRTMKEPVVGTAQWLRLASELVAGLEFMHSKQVIHGDIKPTNILLRPSSSPEDYPNDADPFATSPVYHPVYCDFSSSHVLQPSVQPKEVSAITADYTAPELLESFYQGSQRLAIATFATDVYALGTSLIVPATGEAIFGGASDMQKLSLSRQGQVLEFARQGDQGSRVMKGGMVDRILNGAVKKEEAQRWGIDTWKAALQKESAAHSQHLDMGTNKHSHP
ncbi:MAG: hypothetical protein M1837_000168 [Sclerophora amabilis]|nr:MAG: hypothetical protein M1837_000168 [Sclerophora amabilis]